MTALLDATKQGWRPLLPLGPWEAFLAKGPNRYNWSWIVVRLVDGRARRRSWWLSYNHIEGRLARRPDADYLFTHHGDIAKQLVARLRNWTPQ
jgi:hypothetical protein